MQRFVTMLAALGQGARLEIFRRLVRGGPTGCCVDEIRQSLRMPGSTLSHHLDTLARSGLLTARREGRFIYYAVAWEQAADLIRFLTEDCCADLPERLVPCGTAGLPAAAPARRDAGGDRVTRSRPAAPRAVRAGGRRGRKPT
jgi:ArsR family transcriptional regulator, arsenate/arsenite/antimonite-responsive transcriptional repressor